ncbi:TetR/AcrR family transcriptional regulator [Streptomyces sp. NPDC051909]|uniref:TetR/AcrR family transcriptional regulator n=1 Tax=Streptomyces sp. NPDC051909 TaxID=3154944 RepID=UPI003435BD26
MRDPQPTSAPSTAGRRASARADAARNRRKILDTAAQIVDGHGPETMTMNQVAQASGIGVGTVYRHFGDLAQLLWALLDEQDRQFQEEYLSGPSPRPGAAATQRQHVFLDALVDHVVEQRAIRLAAQKAGPGAQYASGAYVAMHSHLTLLNSQARPGANAALLAHLLLALFSPCLIHHLSVEQQLSVAELKKGIRQLLSFPGIVETPSTL